MKSGAASLCRLLLVAVGTHLLFHALHVPRDVGLLTQGVLFFQR